VAYWQ
jgi:hypothetical protein